MRLLVLFAITLLCSCGSATVKYASPAPKLDSIHAKYYIDTIWGTPTESKVWRVTKDTIVGGKILSDTAYYYPQGRYVADSLGNRIKTKDGKFDSTAVVAIPLPKYLLKEDHGPYLKYFKPK